jgi:hypothetical protein
MPAAGYAHPITLSVYADAAAAAAHTPLKTTTLIANIPWRPASDPTCSDDAWRAADLQCYHGFAFTITFDVRSWNLDLPEQFIYGIAYNTNTWGYSPLGVGGPYESLNVGLHTAPPAVAVGTDVNTDAVFWNTSYAPNYADGGAGGVGTFRLDTDWAPYTPAVQFRTFAVPAAKDDCKNGAWKNLVRLDFTSFKNQGDCVSYVQTGK